jgi:Xaa-Pro aminopeptidase
MATKADELISVPSTSQEAAETVPAKPASHDTEPPAALLAFMTKDWKPPTTKLPSKIRGQEAFAARRRAVSALYPGETIVVPTGHEKIRSNDTVYRFRPSSDFYYLTGNTEPDCVLVLEPRPSGGHTDILYVEPAQPRTEKTFFTDRMKGELWVGPRLGVEQTKARFGISEVRPLHDLAGYLDQLDPSKTRMTRGFSEPADKAVAADRTDEDKALATALSEMRLLKDAQEVRELSAAIDSTHRGFEDVISRLKTAKSEREVEGIFNLRARVEGNDVGYGTIAASGPHACVLHWTRNDGELEPGDLLLLDAGVEGNSHYTADITRTLPISGRFSKEQREIYELVLDAQTQAMAAVRPGNDFMEPNRVAMGVLARGLERLGILPTSAEEALKEEHQFYKRYSLHNVSHMLGLDVHDCAQARQEAYKFGKLKPGMVLTVEPGLYFQLDDLTVPKKYRGIGVRIEDDVLVTARGNRNLSGAIPRSVADVEAWMKRIWAGRRK